MNTIDRTNEIIRADIRRKAFDEAIAIVKQKAAEWAGETSRQWDARPDLAFDAGQMACGAGEIIMALELARDAAPPQDASQK